MSKRRRSSAAEAPASTGATDPLRRRLEDRLPGLRGINTGTMRRHAEIPPQAHGWEPSVASAMNPSVRIAIKGGAVHVDVQLPGMNAGDVVVSVGDRLLTLKGSHCRYGAFEHAVELPQTVSVNAMRLSHRGSQLEIDFPEEGPPLETES